MAALTRCVALLAISLSAMFPSVGRAQTAPPVLVFAAASLQTALTAIAADWQRETGRRVTFSFAGSSALARQLENGAPADLFASADLDWMDWAQQRELIRSETRRTLLGNTLVLIAPRDSTVSVDIRASFPLAAMLGKGRLAIGNPQAVPAGKYAQAALTRLGVWDQVAPRIAGAESVRAALALVARGETPLGIVYETDARSEPLVRIIATFPADLHSPIVYPFARTTGSTNPNADAFLSHLASETAARVFESEGFRVLR